MERIYTPVCTHGNGVFRSGFNLGSNTFDYLGAKLHNMKTDYYHTFYPDTCYHVYNKAISELLLFPEEKYFDRFLEKFDTYLGNYISMYAYALIPNHFHFLVKCRTFDSQTLDKVASEGTGKATKFLEGEISYNDFIVDQFRRFFDSHSKWFNKKNERKGSLFLKKFKRITIRNAEHFRYMLLYIHHNPLHHGFAEAYHLWKYTTYWKYLNVDSSLTGYAAVMNLFDEGRTGFLKFHEENKHGEGIYPLSRHPRFGACDEENLPEISGVHSAIEISWLKD